MMNPSNSVSRQILGVEDVTVSFGGFQALKRLNFSMDAGELRVVIGPNGAGKRVGEVLDLIGLSAKAHRAAGLLAHGEKQWLELGMVMAQDPELLLIDEPVAGMTPRESERTGELLLAMARKHALLVIEHDMTFVRQIAQRVTVLDEGRILCE